MKDEVVKKIENLANRISKAGRIIARDNINKFYTVDRGENYIIEVTSDSGYENICIGNTESDSTDGYMYLYSKNTSEKNSFPDEDVIASFLLKVLNKERLEDGEGKASYFNWDEFGGMEKQLDYFSEVVAKAAKIK